MRSDSLSLIRALDSAPMFEQRGRIVGALGTTLRVTAHGLARIARSLIPKLTFACGPKLLAFRMAMLF
jgi:hypothetical protein